MIQTNKHCFKPGDLVRFTAKDDCTREMELTLYGKIFKVIAVANNVVSGAQMVYISSCDLTINPEECRLRIWAFTSQMFELCRPAEQDEPLPEKMISFDEFFSNTTGGEESE